MKVAIVGGGIAGLSTAWALSRGGHEVVLFEQGPIPNPRGASVDQHRLIRQFYGDQLGYCRLVESAFAAWDRLWRDLGRSHYAETGSLAISTEPGDWTEQSRRTMDAAGLDYEVLDDAALAARHPFLSPPVGCWGLYARRGGLLFAERIVADLYDRLRRDGVDIRTERPVREIDPARARVDLDGGVAESADALVIAAGPWLPRLLPAFAGRATPMRNAVLYLDPPAALAEAWQRAPILVDWGGSDDAYAAPPVGGSDLKIAYGAHRTTGDPDSAREPYPGEAEEMLARFAGRLRDLAEYRVRPPRVCYYMIAPDRRFILERLDRAWVVSACSGHGFKFGPLVGLAVADAVTGRRDAAWTARLLAGDADADDTAVPSLHG